MLEPMAEATLVEREAQLSVLERLLRSVAHGPGHVVWLGGEAGIGKTSLLRALAARRDAAQLWWGGCDALQTPQPLAPLHDIARNGEAGFLGLLGDGRDRAALFDAVLARLQRSDPEVMFVVDDAHWADEATLDLLRFLGRRIDRVPCLLLVAFRDDEVTARHPLRRLVGDVPARLVTRMEVPRLSADAVGLLARRALRSPAGIHAATQGNPFFVTELLQHGGNGVPGGVRDLVLARFARLDPRAQEIIQLASMVPARIERWLVEALLGCDLPALEACLDAGLLTADASSLSFRHELARNAVESSLSAPLAMDLHARILRELEREGSPDVSLARLVHHAARAGDHAAIQRLAPEAARQSRVKGAHREAAAHCRVLLAHAAGLADAVLADLHDQYAYECYLLEQVDEAIQARQASLALWRAVGDRRREGDALRWLSRLHWYDGRTSAAEDYAAQAIAALDPLPPGRELAMAYANRAQLDMLAGESERALQWGAKATSLAARLGDSETEVHALSTIGTAKVDLDDVSGVDDLERALAIALGAGFEEQAARTFSNLAYSYANTGRLEAALAHVDRGIAFCEERDLDSWARFMGGYRCELYLTRGDWERADALAREILDAPNVAAVTRIPALVVIGRIRARRGEPDPFAALDNAWQLAAQPAEIFKKTGLVVAARAEAACLLGDMRAVVAEVGEAWEAYRNSRLYWTPGELAYWLHRAGALDGMPRCCAKPYALQIAGRWREAAEAWHRHGAPYERARALAEGDTDAQLEALATFDRMGARPDAERLRRQLQCAGVRGVPRGPRASTRANPHDLTNRELETLRLLCAGLRNAEIAERLSRSVRTVDHHLAAIFAKLGVATRTEAVALALQSRIGAEK